MGLHIKNCFCGHLVGIIFLYVFTNMRHLREKLKFSFGEIREKKTSRLNCENICEISETNVSYV